MTTISLDISDVNAHGGMTTTLFAERADGTFYARSDYVHTMNSAESMVIDSVREVRVNLWPGPRQLKQLLKALSDGRLTLDRLARLDPGNYGGKLSLVIAD